MNNPRPILSLITRTAASNNGVIVSMHPPLFHPPLSLSLSLSSTPPSTKSPEGIPRVGAIMGRVGVERWAPNF